MSDEKQAAFLADVRESIGRYRRHARSNYRASYACYLVAIAASAASTLVIAFEALPKAGLASLTALPGAVLLFNSVLALEAKTQWYWQKARFYDGIAARLEFEGEPLAEVSASKRDFDLEMEKVYPKFGMLPSSTPRE